jgi:hypothetical protein
MVVTSSYSNNHDPVPDYKAIEVDPDARYRRIPVARALGYSRDRIAECDREGGHVLKVRDGFISCVRCEAEWKDEGF